MVGLAIAMFIGLFAFGHELLGWSGDSSNEVQLGLFLAFILGIVCGYKTKG
jgi:ABC-type nitrate/sulfonate/bicarbonate transport system permease component